MLRSPPVPDLALNTRWAYSQGSQNTVNCQPRDGQKSWKEVQVSVAEAYLLLLTAIAWELGGDIAKRVYTYCHMQGLRIKPLGHTCEGG